MTRDSSARVVRPGFYAAVHALVSQVPAGRVTTYGDLATLLGSPRVARQVGFALAALRDASVPWHRVINSRGRISFKGDTVRAVLQRDRLEAEGVVFSEAGVVCLARYRFEFRGALPGRAGKEDEEARVD